MHNNTSSSDIMIRVECPGCPFGTCELPAEIVEAGRIKCAYGGGCKRVDPETARRWEELDASPWATDARYGIPAVTEYLNEHACSLAAALDAVEEKRRNAPEEPAPDYAAREEWRKRHSEHLQARNSSRSERKPRG